MAKGKEAAAAARRRYEAAMEVVDRLTTENAELKIRMKEAEGRASRLDSASTYAAVKTAKNDDDLAAALKALEGWLRSAQRDKERRKKAIGEMYQKVFFDALKDNATSGVYLLEDRRQFLEQRYPSVMNALFAGTLEHVDPSKPVAWKSRSGMAERRMSDESLRRFQRLMGERMTVTGGPDRDIADVWGDMLDAVQSGFSREEIIELLDIERPSDERTRANATAS